MCPKVEGARSRAVDKVELWSSLLGRCTQSMMAENKRPLSITIDSPTKHINFATIKKQRTISKNNNLLQSPMVSNRNYNASGGVDTGPDRLSVLVDTARMQLISPPPEEMLRKTSVYTLFFVLCYVLIMFYLVATQCPVYTFVIGRYWRLAD